MLIRAVYRGVIFHQPLTPGTPTVDVTVFEPTTNPTAIADSPAPAGLPAQRRQADGRRRVFHPEQFESSCRLFQAGRKFRIYDSAGRGTRPGFHLWPLRHACEAGHDRQGKGTLRDRLCLSARDRMACASPTSVPYAGNQRHVRASLQLRCRSAYCSSFLRPCRSPARDSTPAGTEQGFNVFSKAIREGGNGFRRFDFRHGATAPRKPSAGGGERPDQVNGRDSGPAPEPRWKTAPARLDDEKWILLGGLAAIFAVGVGLLLRNSRFLDRLPASLPQPPGPRPARRNALRNASEAGASPHRLPSAERQSSR